MTFSLLWTSNKRILWWLKREWEESLLPQHSTRKAWQELPPVEMTATRKILAKYTAKQQHTLLQEISGAFQTNVQQSAWDPGVSRICKFCTQEDTRHHRVFTCHATEYGRQGFQHDLQTIQDDKLMFHELPFLTRHPKQSPLVLMWDTLTIPKMQPSMQQGLQQLMTQGNTITFYTDGSCMQGTCPTASYASFAIACDFATTDAERVAQVRNLGSDCLVTSMKPVFVSRLPGEQCIRRAEIFALVCV